MALGAPVLGGVTLPEAALIQWQQTRTVARAASRYEYSDMSAEVVVGPTSATKRIVTISAQGVVPPGLDALDRTTTHALTYYVRDGSGVWQPVTATVWLWNEIEYRDAVWADGRLGLDAWSLTLREA
jgi:hypothetical protein